MTAVTVSVIIVSQQRPDFLVRCLQSVSQLLYRHFEIIVVADAEGIAAVQALPIPDRLQVIRFDEPNLSLGRNVGLMRAAGEVVAFIDDDAVAEPGWLSHLLSPFADARVWAAGGFVRGRNGISYQWNGQMISTAGLSTNIPAKGMTPTVIQAGNGEAVNIVGTNCAYRRNRLAAIGGFDPAFRYYLDEADVNMRLAKSGGKTAIVPLAEVHHGVAASSRRHSNRMPRSLFEVGASHAVFLRKHAQPETHSAAANAFIDHQRESLSRHMVAGRCEPREVGNVLVSLQHGLAEGFERPLSPLPPIPASNRRFKAFHELSEPPRHHVVFGYRADARRLRKEAAILSGERAIVSLYMFSRTTLYHRVTFCDGVWEQTGGLFGRADRKEPLVQLKSLAGRVRQETNRSAMQRYPAE